MTKELCTKVPCHCVREGKITDDDLPYDRVIAPYGLDGHIADRDCARCSGTGFILVAKENRKSAIAVHLHSLKINSKTVYLDDLELGGIAALVYDEPDPHSYGFLTIKLYIDRDHLTLDLPPRFNPEKDADVKIGGDE